MRVLVGLLAVVFVTTACSSTVNTLPPVVSPSAPIGELVLEIPEGLEVRSASYSATMYSNVSGTSGNYGITSTSVGGRAFVQVLAVDRATQEQVLLVYENIATRTKPIQMSRFRVATGVTAPS